MILKTLLFKFFRLVFGKNYYSFLLKLLHFKKNTFKGYSLRYNINNINNIINIHNINSLLDYGCGKALEYSPNPYNKKKLEIYLFDPYFQKYKKPPIKKYELTICTDVMEHVEEENITNVLNNIYKHTDKAVYFSIATRHAKKNLPDGRNAHVTIFPEEKWEKILRSLAPENLIIYVQFNNYKNMYSI